MDVDDTVNDVLGTIAVILNVPVRVPAAVGVTKINELAVTVVLFIKTEPAVRTSDPTLVLEPEGISNEPVMATEPEINNEPVIVTAAFPPIITSPLVDSKALSGLVFNEATLGAK